MGASFREVHSTTAALSFAEKPFLPRIGAHFHEYKNQSIYREGAMDAK